MGEYFHDILGVIGVLMVVLAHFELQRGAMKSDDLRYLILNILGPSLILISLFYEWNVSAFLVESFWLIITLFGLWKKFNKKPKLQA